MCKKLGSLVLLFFFIFCNIYSEQTKKEYTKGLGLVLVSYNNETLATGFFVDNKGTLVTCYHVIRGAMYSMSMEYPFWVTPFSKRDVYLAEVLYADKKKDILILKIDFAPEFWFDKFLSPRSGMDCIVYGLPKGWLVFKEGKVISNYIYYLVGVDIKPYPGMSGSVVLDITGKVLGMVNMDYNYAAFVPSIVIKNVLRSLK